MTDSEKEELAARGISPFDSSVLDFKPADCMVKIDYDSLLDASYGCISAKSLCYVDAYSTTCSDRNTASELEAKEKELEELKAKLEDCECMLENERKINDILISKIEYCKKNGIWTEEKA